MNNFARISDLNRVLTVCFLTFSQVTAVNPVAKGQCITLGYESVFPLVLLTLHGGDLKPHEFPTEGTKAMAGTGEIEICHWRI